MDKKKITVFALGAFLILSGLAGFIPGIDDLGVIIAILACAAGLMILAYPPSLSYRLGWILAAIFLIARGLIRILNFSFTGLGTIMAVLALSAGILLLIRMPKTKGHIGFLSFFVWLILVGLLGLISLGWLDAAIDIAALAAGILLIFGV